MQVVVKLPVSKDLNSSLILRNKTTVTFYKKYISENHWLQTKYLICFSVGIPDLDMSHYLCVYNMSNDTTEASIYEAFPDNNIIMAMFKKDKAFKGLVTKFYSSDLVF